MFPFSLQLNNWKKAFYYSLWLWCHTCCWRIETQIINVAWRCAIKKLIQKLHNCIHRTPNRSLLFSKCEYLNKGPNNVGCQKLVTNHQNREWYFIWLNVWCIRSVNFKATSSVEWYLEIHINMMEKNIIRTTFILYPDVTIRDLTKSLSVATFPHRVDQRSHFALVWGRCASPLWHLCGRRQSYFRGPQLRFRPPRRRTALEGIRYATSLTSLTWHLLLPEVNMVKEMYPHEFGSVIHFCISKLPPNLWYQTHKIPKLKFISSSLALGLCAIYWRQLLSREWRCSWSSADRRRSNYTVHLSYQQVYCLRCGLY